MEREALFSFIANYSPNPANSGAYSRTKLFCDHNGFVALATYASNRQTS
jgi:hypothetical protein